MQDQRFVPEKYDPVEYWNRRSQPNTEKAPGISPKHAEFFRRHSGDYPSVMELGPGVGRLFPLYASARDKIIHTLDLSRQHESTIDAAATAVGLRVDQKFIASSDAPFPFRDKSFDVGVSAYVFIHVPFEYIRHSMSEMARVCHKTIVFASNDSNWAQSEKDVKPSSHVFGHDYKALCDELGFSVYEFVSHLNSDGSTSISLCYGTR